MMTVLGCIVDEHNIWLVIVAALLCGAGSWVTARLFLRTASTSGMERIGWYFLTAVTAGVAIWCTHFVAMLGFDTGTAVSFDPTLTVVSLLIAVAGSTAGFAIAGSRLFRFSPALGGAVVGLAIAAMHYTGMMAYRVQGIVSWDMPYLVASIALSVGLSALALHAAIHSARHAVNIMATVLALAIVALHFTGMTAFRVEPLLVDASLSNPGALLAFAIAVAGMAFIIVGVGMVSYLIDDNMRSKANHREQQQNLLLQRELDFSNAMLNSLPGIFYHIDQKGRFLRWNTNHTAVMGYSLEDYERRHVLESFPEHERETIMNRIAEVFEKGESSVEANLLTKDGRLIPYLLTGVNLHHGDEPSFVGIGIDITERRRAEDRVRQLAEFDTLTGLPNRNTFNEQLAFHLATPGSHAGLLYIDLDGFKLVNDTRGHKTGDILLRQVADRLRAECDGSGVKLARLGGDEFVVLLPHNDAGEAAALADRIVSSLSTPYDLDYDRSIQIGASVGIAFAPDHANDGGTLLSRADIALYSAKAAGKGTTRVFVPEMETRIHERTRLEEALRAALDDMENLFVFYQPIVDIGTGKVTAREALVRWHHPERGWVSPGEFVPVAEQSGLIDRLGLFVLNRACQDAAGWEDGARVAVNISAGQLGKGTLPSIVLEALVISGLSPQRLEIEVTETALLADEDETIADLRRVRDMGVRVALDDFGTGYSSLAHLRVFPFDKIKIDGSFVRDSVDRPESAAVVQTIAELGRRLGVTTVAEGVETQDQLDRVREEGCTEIQGYLYGRPAPSERDAAQVEELNGARRKAAA